MSMSAPRPRSLVHFAFSAALATATGAPALAQEPSPQQVASALERLLTEIIDSRSDSVVAIAQDRRRRGAEQPPPQPFDPSGLRQFAPDSPDFIPVHYGTGVVVDRRGLVLTCYHVLGIDNDDYVVDHYVTTRDRKVYQARIKAADQRSDLAVLELVPPAEGVHELSPIRLGDASTLRPGRVVLALTNPFAVARDGQSSAAWGIVANVGRKSGLSPEDPRESSGAGKPTLYHHGGLIQTDARLHIGSSGGPLLDLHGEMVGLTTVAAAQAAYEHPAGYAIPVDDTFRRILDALKEGREVEYGFLGVQPSHLAGAEVHSGLRGVRIERVVRGTPADRAGLRRGDVVTEIDGAPVHDADGLIFAVGRLAPRQLVRLSVVRNGAPTLLTSELTKHRVTTRWIATNRPAPWRGIRVDYPTAVLAVQQMLEVPSGCVAVREVERDSPAAKLGFQRGALITHVAGQRVSTPAEFLRAVQGRRGPVPIVRLEGDAPVTVVLTDPT
jgi:S1-C subfamily serine protease